MSYIKKYLESLDDIVVKSDLLSDGEKEFLSSYDAKDLKVRIDENISGETESADLALKNQKLKKAEYQNETLKHELEELKKNSAKKDDFYETVKCLTISWLSFIAIILLIDSIEIPWNEGVYEFDIENNVLIALVTSTTASVIGLFFIVGRSLFPNNGYNENGK